jgi:hypothetical protein
VARLEAELDQFDAKAWCEFRNSFRTPLKIQSETQNHADLSHLHNPYAGVLYAWQLTETVDEFLGRLPPSTTHELKYGPWIFICNPYINRKSKEDAQNQMVRGSEDEAPEEYGMDLKTFLEGGMERLHFVTEFHDELKKSRATPAAKTRETNKAAADATSDILNLAHVLHVRCGKWMLFCSDQTVDEIWAAVAKATADNQLGIAAKVATRQDVDDDRLVCVYTADFADKDDVRRVALKLKELGLFQTRGKPLYYKPGE